MTEKWGSHADPSALKLVEGPHWSFGRRGQGTPGVAERLSGSQGDGLVAATYPERVIAALISALILLGLVAMLVIGLAPPAFRTRLGQTLTAFAVRPPAPEHAVRVRARSARAVRSPGGGGSPVRAPRALPAQAAPPAAPLVIVPLPVPVGGGSEAGAGTGGEGSGIGVGAGAGSGPGAGPGRGLAPAVHARQTHGHLSPGDVPDGVLPPGASAGVRVRYVVGTDGLVSGCTVTGQSGIPQIDAVPCPLIERRFRFRPARDAAGRPTPETIEETHTWFEPQRR